jgi:acyl carrier protein
MTKKAKDGPSFDAFEGPATPLEMTLAGLFSSILGTDRIGINDNFFELGGGSLQAAWLLILVQESFGLKLPPESDYSQLTVAHLASVITQIQEEGEMGRTYLTMEPE